MGPSDKKLPQFFKVFQPQQSSENLKLPPAFEEKIPGEIPSRVFLRNRNSTSGKPWLVDVGRIDGRLCFQGGWSKFVLENSLNFGEFLVFKYNGQRIFDVLILGRHGIEKEFMAEGTKELVNGDGDEDEDKDEDEDEDEDEEMRYTMSRNISSMKNLSEHITNSNEDDSDEDDSEDEDFKPTRKFRKF